MNTFLSKMASECFRASGRVRSSRKYPYGVEMLTTPTGEPNDVFGHIFTNMGLKLPEPTMGPVIIVEEAVGKGMPAGIQNTIFQICICNDTMTGRTRRGAVAATLKKLANRLQKWGDML